jgi:hypothetical protein
LATVAGKESSEYFDGRFAEAHHVMTSADTSIAADQFALAKYPAKPVLGLSECPFREVNELIRKVCPHVKPNETVQ